MSYESGVLGQIVISGDQEKGVDNLGREVDIEI